MKTLVLLVVLVMCSVISFGQTNSEIIEKMYDNGFKHEVVVEFPGKTKHEIYTHTRQWFGEMFRSGNDVVNSDILDVVIVGKGNILDYEWHTRYHFTMTVMFKDNRMKVRIIPNKLGPETPGQQIFPPLEKFYSDYRNNKNGFTSRTGNKKYKEFLFVTLIHGTNTSMVETLTNKINQNELANDDW